MPHKEQSTAKLSSPEAGVGKDSRSSKKKDAAKVRPTGQKQREVTGLCVNCDKRSFCRHCLQLGGVWFCEEYE